MAEIDYGARIAVLEHRVNNLDSKIDGLDKKLDKRMEELNEKIDQLLDLRSRGVGAFWLASILFGTGIFGLIATLISWMKT